MSENATVGSTFESLLDEEGLTQEVYGAAAKRVIAWQISEQMRKLKMTKTTMAASMKTSRAQLDRLLDPENVAVQLDTILKAAKACGLTLKIELV